MQELINDFLLTESEIQKFKMYKEFLEEKNKVMNLTSITGDDIYIKHFYDSLLLYRVNPNMDTLLDIGTGAGFPGVPYAIKNNNTQVILVEPIKKRCLFLEELTTKLNLNNTTILNERSENLKLKASYATCRAVSKINILLELIIPHLNVDGIFYCLKSANYQEELHDASNALKQLDTQVEHIYRFSLPNNMGERVVIAFKKVKETNKLYPRPYANITKKPL